MWVGYYAGNTHLTATRPTSYGARPAEEQGLVRIYIRAHRSIQELSEERVAVAARVFDLKELGSAKNILFRSASGGRVSSSPSNQAAYCVFFLSAGGVCVMLAVRRLYQRSLAGARAMSC